ncbi:MAG: transposase zinc-binding domain-containing protein [Candidatus Syntropharchaeales archaeon]
MFEIEEVEKMLQCGDPDKGFTTYRCPDCENIQRIPFTCKDTSCSRSLMCSGMYLRMIVHAGRS